VQEFGAVRTVHLSPTTEIEAENADRSLPRRFFGAMSAAPTARKGIPPDFSRFKIEMRE